MQGYDQAITLRPDYAQAWANRGTALQEPSDWDAALGSYDRALQIRPDYAQAWSNRGMVLHDLRRLEEGLASYDRALDLRPDFPDALYGKSISLLLQGDYAAGWPLYEWRRKHAVRLHGGAPRVFRWSVLAPTCALCNRDADRALLILEHGASAGEEIIRRHESARRDAQQRKPQRRSAART